MAQEDDDIINKNPKQLNHRDGGTMNVWTRIAVIASASKDYWKTKCTRKEIFFNVYDFQRNRKLQTTRYVQIQTLLKSTWNLK